MAGVSAALLTLVLCVCLMQCTVTSFDRSFWKPKFAVYPRATSENCTRSGPKCSLDCSQRLNCITTGNNNFHMAVESCRQGQLCDPYNKICSSSEITCPKFACGSSGVFPDLLDCAGFHVCDSNLVDAPGSCDEGYMYNAKTQECDQLNVNNSHLCDNTPVPSCKGNEHGTLESDPSIYYICSSGVPKLFLCPKNQQYNTETLECADASLACVDIDASKHSPTNYTDPNNCERYYTCTAKGKFAAHNTCQSGRFFNSTSRACENGTCGTRSKKTAGLNIYQD